MDRDTGLDFIIAFGTAVFIEVAVSLIVATLWPQYIPIINPATHKVEGQLRDFALSGLALLAVCFVVLVLGVVLVKRNRVVAMGLIFSIPAGMFLAMVMMGLA